MGFTLTERAQKFVRRVIRLSGGTGGMRLKVRPGGCSGFNAEFEPTANSAADEQQVLAEGLPLFLDAESRILLEGVTVDFIDTVFDSGFKFYDPKAGAAVPAKAG